MKFHKRFYWPFVLTIRNLWVC